MVSVVIPAFQAEGTLERAIRSGISLAGGDGEVIVINDGSSDGTSAICQNAAERYSNVIYIEQLNRGRSAARNVGLDVARGDWITFLDSDDWIFAGALPAFYERALSSTADIVVFGDAPEYQARSGTLMTADGIRLRDAVMRPSLLRGEPAEWFNLRTVWGKLYRASAIENARFISGLRFGEDALFNITVYGGRRIELVDACLYRYDLCEATTCSTFSPADTQSLSRFISAANGIRQSMDLDIGMVSDMCIAELLEMFYRAAASSVSASEVASAFEAVLKSHSWLNVGHAPERKNLFEQARAQVAIGLLETGAGVCAVGFEKVRNVAKSAIKGGLSHSPFAAWRYHARRA